MTEPARHAVRRRSRVRQLLVGVSIALVVVLTSGAGAMTWVVRHLQGNITATDIISKLGADRPAAAPVSATGGRPLNVLVMGSDSREGANGFIGGTKDVGRSDTTLLLHLSASEKWATAVSIPRDSMVDMPTCVSRAGGTYPAGLRMFNEAYTIGGPGCTVRTVEQLTGIRIDHYVVIDFAGFKDMVDALGTVQVCLPQAVNDTRHHIVLPAGRTRVDGTQALAYVRERYVLGDGSDLSRIGRQQAFLSSILQQAMSAGTLTDPVRLYAFLNAATKSVTMDPQLASLPRLAALAGAIRAVGLSNVQFITVPTGVYPPDHNRLQWTAGASDLWAALRADQRVSTSAKGGRSTQPAGGGTDLTAVTVRVLNGAGTPGLAGTAAQQMRTLGVKVAGVGNATTPGATATLVRYGPGQAAAAEALAAHLPGARLQQRSGLGTTIQVIAGSEWVPVTTGASASAAAAPSASASASAPVRVSGATGRSAATSICS